MCHTEIRRGVVELNGEAWEIKACQKSHLFIVKKHKKNCTLFYLKKSQQISSNDDSFMDANPVSALDECRPEIGFYNFWRLVWRMETDVRGAWKCSRFVIQNARWGLQNISEISFKSN